MWKKILSHLKEYRPYALISPFLISLEALAGVAIPKIMGYLVDKGIKPGNMSAVYLYGGLMILVVVVALIIGLINVRIGAKAATGLSKNLRQEFFQKIQNFSFSTIDKYSTGSLVTRVTTDITFIQNSFFMMIRLAFRAPVILILSIVMTFSISAKLAGVFLAIVIIMFAFMFVMVKVVMPFFVKMLKKIDRMNAKIQEKINGIRVVKTFVRENYESENFEVIAKDVMYTQKKAEKFLVYAEPLGMIVGYIVSIFAVWAGGTQLLKGALTEGQLTSFISYASFILTSSMLVMMAFGQIMMSQASVNRIQEVLEDKPEVEDESHLEEHVITKGEIEFKEVCFRYPYKQKGEGEAEDKNSGRKKKQEPVLNCEINSELEECAPTLKEISLKINAGETVGIIGSTGSGKSTLVQLIPRLYEVNKGEIFVDGVNVKDYKVKDLRDNVAIVLQKNILFSGTIRDNLLWGNENASQEDIELACQKAQASEFIDSLKDGYDTVLEQGATNLSGGQKQRVCIARALLKKPKILILDDSTSAVDMSTEAKIRDGLKKDLQGTTVIIIAQRVASVKDADKIIVLDAGRIDAIGSHKELLDSNQIYKDVYRSQVEGVVYAK